jgi:hypothetical protein
MMDDQGWQELRERLLKAAAALDVLAASATATERKRLDAKSTGVLLALSYMDDMDRAGQ